MKCNKNGNSFVKNKTMLLFFKLILVEILSRVKYEDFVKSYFNSSVWVLKAP
jgi:hypothetical protein